MLYQRVAAQLAIVQTRSPDPVLVARLSRSVADARAAVTGTHSAAWRDITRFFVVTFPVAVYRTRRLVGADGGSLAGRRNRLRLVDRDPPGGAAGLAACRERACADQ